MGPPTTTAALPLGDDCGRQLSPCNADALLGLVAHCRGGSERTTPAQPGRDDGRGDGLCVRGLRCSGCRAESDYRSDRRRVLGVARREPPGIPRLGRGFFGFHHRVLEAKAGKLLGKDQAHHVCGVPVCVNPDHLVANSARENIGEMQQRRYFLARIAEFGGCGSGRTGSRSPGPEPNRHAGTLRLFNTTGWH